MLTLVSVTIQTVIAHAQSCGSDFFDDAFLDDNNIRVLTPSEAVYDARTSTYYFVTADKEHKNQKRERYTIRKIDGRGNVRTVIQACRYNTYIDALHKIYTALTARARTSK